MGSTLSFSQWNKMIVLCCFFVVVVVSQIFTPPSIVRSAQNYQLTIYIYIVNAIHSQPKRSIELINSSIFNTFLLRVQPFIQISVCEHVYWWAIFIAVNVWWNKTPALHSFSDINRINHDTMWEGYHFLLAYIFPSSRFQPKIEE